MFGFFLKTRCTELTCRSFKTIILLVSSYTEYGSIGEHGTQNGNYIVSWNYYCLTNTRLLTLLNVKCYEKKIVFVQQNTKYDTVLNVLQTHRRPY